MFAKILMFQLSDTEWLGEIDWLRHPNCGRTCLGFKGVVRLWQSCDVEVFASLLAEAICTNCETFLNGRVSVRRSDDFHYAHNTIASCFICLILSTNQRLQLIN